jgi:hypothetical protein
MVFRMLELPTMHSTPRSILRPAALLFAALLTAGSALALTVDTSGSWGGSVNIGWQGSGQSLTVDNTENVLNTFSFYAHADSNGKTFDVSVSDALNGGSTLFSTSTLVVGGLNTVNINQAFTGGSTIFVLFDYNGFTGSTLHFQTDAYSGGNSSCGPVGSQTAFPGLDHRFVATFSGDAASVPDATSTFGLLASALTAAFVIRRTRKAVASVRS